MASTASLLDDPKNHTDLPFPEIHTRKKYLLIHNIQHIFANFLSSFSVKIETHEKYVGRKLYLSLFLMC